MKEVQLYHELQTNINMRLARARSNIAEFGHCDCEPINGKRCTVAHGCLNRISMTECPEVILQPCINFLLLLILWTLNVIANTCKFCKKSWNEILLLQDCDATYFERRNALTGGTKRQVLKRTAGLPGDENSLLPSQKMCTNNFLRYHDTNDDKSFMEEKPTKLKGFGAFAKCDIDKVRYQWNDDSLKFRFYRFHQWIIQNGVVLYLIELACLLLYRIVPQIIRSRRKKH